MTNRELTASEKISGAMADEATACLNMLVLCGDLGGKRGDETYSQYLRRLIDFITVQPNVVGLIEMFQAAGYDDTKAGNAAFENFNMIAFLEEYRKLQED